MNERREEKVIVNPGHPIYDFCRISYRCPHLSHSHSCATALKIRAEHTGGGT